MKLWAFVRSAHTNPATNDVEEENPQQEMGWDLVSDEVSTYGLVETSRDRKL